MYHTARFKNSLGVVPIPHSHPHVHYKGSQIALCRCFLLAHAPSRTFQSPLSLQHRNPPTVSPARLLLQSCLIVLPHPRACSPKLAPTGPNFRYCRPRKTNLHRSPHLRSIMTCRVTNSQHRASKCGPKSAMTWYRICNRWKSLKVRFYTCGRPVHSSILYSPVSMVEEAAEQAEPTPDISSSVQEGVNEASLYIATKAIADLWAQRELPFHGTCRYRRSHLHTCAHCFSREI